MSGKLLGAVAAIAAAPLTLVLGIGLGSASGSSDPSNVDPACFGNTGIGIYAGHGEKINDNQAQNAQTIYQVSLQLKLPTRAAVIAIATSMQEDKLRNSKVATNYDSLGLFQQRPSQGWGTAAQVTDPVYAARQFYKHLIKVPNWQTIPLTQAAQAVQGSGTPGAYAQWEPFANKIVAALVAKASTCPTDTTPSGLGGRIVAAAEKYLGMAYQFGGGTWTGPTVGTNSNGSGKPGFDCSGLTMFAVYQATGGKVKLDHYVPNQWNNPHVHRVGVNQLQPGDLIAINTESPFSHVGIYIGSGKFIQAPHTGDVVKISPFAGYYRDRFTIGGHITL